MQAVPDKDLEVPLTQLKQLVLNAPLQVKQLLWQFWHTSTPLSKYPPLQGQVLSVELKDLKLTALQVKQFAFVVEQVLQE